MENSINQMVEEKMKVEKSKIVAEWKLSETTIREEFKFAETRMEENLRIARLRVEEKIKEAETRIRTEITMWYRRTSAENSMKLQFVNKISQPILSGEELKGEGNTCIQVSLVNNSSGTVVEVGPESSASVEIVVLKKDLDPLDRDDWTVEEFDEQIVNEVQGKKSLLEGNVHVKLQRGRGALGKVKFRHHVMEMKPRPEFHLGARIGDSSKRIFVREAKTESFIVKGYRKKYYQKHEIPSLSAKVWRLHNIGKGGNIDRRLQIEKIYDVEGFLIRLLKDPEGLKNVVRTGLNKWEAIVEHTRRCPSGNRRYCYIDSQRKTGIVFNILGQVLGLYSKGQYSNSTAINMLSENKADADELLTSAINHWADIVSFDDEDSVNQYFTGTRTSIDDSNPPGISQYHGQYYPTEETPTNISNSSFHGIISNSTREINGSEDLDFPLGIDDMEILRNSPNFKPSPCPNLDFEAMFSGFDWPEVTNDNCGMQRYEGFVDETNAESGILVVEPSEVVIPVCKAPKRWRMLFLCFKIVLSKKMVPSSEKHKIFEACRRKM